MIKTLKRIFIGLSILSILSLTYYYYTINATRVPLEVIDEDAVSLKTGEKYSGRIIEYSDNGLVFKPTVIGSIDVSYTFLYKDIADITPGRLKVEETLNSPLLKSYYKIENFKEDMHALYLNDDFAKLEKKIVSFRKNKSRFASGEWKIDYFYIGLNEKYTDESIELINKNIEKLNVWKKTFPDSITPIILLIDSYIDLAWEYRGGFYSKGVSKEGWKGFKHNLKTAQKLINDYKDNNKVLDPRFLVMSVVVSSALGNLRLDVTNFIRQTMAYDPDYYPTYIKISSYLLPRWGVRYGVVENFAKWLSKENNNDEMYARISGNVLQSVKKEGYNKFNFDWSKIRNGFEEVINKYPSNFYHLHTYAWMACYYNDYKLTKNLTDTSGYLWNSQSIAVWGSFANYYDCKSLANSNKKNKINLHNEIRKGNYEKFSEIIKGNIDLNIKNARGETPLQYAISSTLYDFAEALIKSGADIRISDDDGFEAIHLAAKSGVKNLVSILLSKGVPINALTKDHLWSPLHYAVRYGHVDVVKVLLEDKNININLQNSDKATVLHYAAFLGSDELVTLLLDRADLKLNITDEYSRTPLNRAQEKGYDKIEKLLLAKGAVASSNALTRKKIDLAKGFMSKGVKAHNKGDYKKAKEFYLKSSEINPFSPDAFGNIALINMFEKDYNACLENTAKAINVDKDNAHAIYSTAQCLFMLSKPKAEFLEYYKKYIKLKPNNFRTKKLLQKYPELSNVSK